MSVPLMVRILIPIDHQDLQSAPAGFNHCIQSVRITILKSSKPILKELPIPSRLQLPIPHRLCRLYYILPQTGFRIFVITPQRRIDIQFLLQLRNVSFDLRNVVTRSLKYFFEVIIAKTPHKQVVEIFLRRWRSSLVHRQSPKHQFHNYWSISDNGTILL